MFFNLDQSYRHDGTHPSLLMSWGPLWWGCFLTCVSTVLEGTQTPNTVVRLLIKAWPVQHTYPLGHTTSQCLIGIYYMYICTKYTHLHTYVCIHIYVSIYVHVCIYAIWMYTLKYVYRQKCMSLYMFVYISEWIYAYMYVCRQICLYVHTHYIYVCIHTCVCINVHRQTCMGLYYVYICT